MFNCLGKFQSPGKPPAAFHKCKTLLGRGALLHTEPVSGFSAVSAVSAAPRFARNQCYLTLLALGARCSFAIPKCREEPETGLAVPGEMPTCLPARISQIGMSCPHVRSKGSSALTARSTSAASSASSPSSSSSSAARRFARAMSSVCFPAGVARRRTARLSL